MGIVANQYKPTGGASCGELWRALEAALARQGLLWAMWYKCKYVDDLNAMPAELLKAERGSQ